MGSRTDVAELLSQCRWSEEGSYLGEIAKSSGFPCVAKVSRGQYVGLGQPSFSNPSLVSHVLLVSAGKQLSVVAQCVKFKNARQRVVPFGPTLVIPQDFDGHFEILNEDGKAVPCIESVDALARRFPDSCLVREALKGYKPDVKSSIPPLVLNPLGSKDPDGPPVLIGNGCGGGVNKSSAPSNGPAGLLNSASTNYRISDKSRVVQPGEILVLVGEVSVPTGKNKVTKYLRCFDSKGQTVFLASSQKGKFSPLARQESISGVHTTKNILSKRMPLMVRLVDGKPPVMPSSKSSSFKFVPELRLYCTLQEELIFGMPLSQSSKEIQNIVPMPLTVPLKFQVCRNMGELEQMKEFSRVYEKVKTLVQHSKSYIQIYDINLKKELRFDGRQWKSYAPPIFLTPSLTDPGEMILNDEAEAQDTKTPLDPSPNYNEIPDMQDYEDIDQIYDYVRGIKPPPARLLNTSAQAMNNNSNSQQQTTGGGAVIIEDSDSKQKIRESCNGKLAKGEKEKVHKPNTVVTITSSTPAPVMIPSHGPDVIPPNVHKNSSNSNNHLSKNANRVSSNNVNYSNIPPPVPKHHNQDRYSSSNNNASKQILRPSKSVERLVDDDRPIPPPIETIPSLQNKFQILQQQSVSNGVSVSVSNNYGNNNKSHGKVSVEKKLTSKTQIDSKAYTEEFVHHHHNEQGTQIQIQIRSDAPNNYVKDGNNLQNSHLTTSQSTESVSSNIIITTTNHPQNVHTHSHNLHQHQNHNRLHKLDSTGGSISTSGTPTNTSGSSQSKSSGCSGLSGGDKGRMLISNRPKTHLYIKHNSNNGNSNSKEISNGAGTGNSNLSGILAPATDPSGNGLSGSPTNRIIFRRSPIFDCRYKSMNDLNRSSLESCTGSGGGGSSRQKYFYQSHHHPNLYNNGSNGSSGSGGNYHHLHNHAHTNKIYTGLASSRDNILGSSQTNLNLLNMNLLKSSGGKRSRGMMFRPKSLTNIALDDGLYSGLVFGSSNGGGGSSHHLHNSHGITGGVKKKLADMVVPSHHHAIHTPPPPPIELMQKVSVPLKSSSQRNSSYKYHPNLRKASIQSANLFL